jgi:cobalt-precorrin-5B (C1)-methyltransferase
MPLWDDAPPENAPLKRGWTTGSCAAAAAKAALLMLRGQEPAGLVEIGLPNGQRISFAIAQAETKGDAALVGIIKDAGDDPDVTHGAMVVVEVMQRDVGHGICFAAGKGVGTVTKPGLPLPVGEPAINPVPRSMIAASLREANDGIVPDVLVTISIPGGEELAKKTLNGRLGIIGGLSILGTTGIVIPYSCAAWIHSIHRGIDVARGEGLTHIAGATGATSEAAVQARLALPESALIDMGDFAGGMLKYLKRHPIARVTIAGGPAKMSKLAQGMLDLHSRAGALDLKFVADLALAQGASPALASAISQANSGLHTFELAAESGFDLGRAIASRAREIAIKAVAGSDIFVDVMIFDRAGNFMAQSD